MSQKKNIVFILMILNTVANTLKNNNYYENNLCLSQKIRFETELTYIQLRQLFS